MKTHSTAAYITMMVGTVLGITATFSTTVAQPLPSRDIRIQQPRIDPRGRSISGPIRLAAHTVIGNNVSNAFWSPAFNEIALSGQTNAVYSTVTGNSVVLPANPQAFNSDGGRLVLRTSTDSTVVWDLRSRSAVVRFFRSGALVSFDRNDGKVVAGPGGNALFGGGGITRVWSMATGQQIFSLGFNSNQSFNDPNQQVTINATANPEFSPNGARLLLTHAMGTATANSVNAPARAEIFDATSWNRLATISMAGEDRVNIARWSRDNSKVLVAGSNVQVHNATNGSLIASININRTINSAEWNATGSRIVTATDDARFQVWDAATGSLVRTVEQLTGVSTSFLYSASFSPNGNRIMTTVNRTVKIFDATSGALLQTFDHGSPVRVARWRPSSDGILTIETVGGRAHTWKVD